MIPQKQLSLRPSVPLAGLFWASLAFALGALAALGTLNRQLELATAPAGIVSFELCAYTSSCSSIVQGWGPSAQLLAALSLGADYLVLVSYSAALCCGLLLVARRVSPGLRGLTVGAAWAAWVAGAADAVENYYLARLLLAPSAQGFAWPASVAATVKFVVLTGTLGWLVAAYVRYGRRPAAHTGAAEA